MPPWFMTNVAVAVCPAAACDAYPGYSVLVNYDGLGGNIGVAVSVPAAAAACSADMTCVAFNNNGEVKAELGALDDSADGICLYTKSEFQFFI